ncbi:MAG: bifunctional precorrin-2 dehydrogenase/sirohydrochlorin ferrochelatase [Lachnospiraceae bacterium]|nr:bifunctional precorrin-2 dehydrogenase/sirohydrochlorin ferrochelatase [Lachnospiraceae bacterium]
MLFPLFVDLSEKDILFVGGGAVADRRVHALLEFAGHISVVAPELTEGLRQLADSGRIHTLQRSFEPEDPKGRDFVFAATDDARLNRRIAALCREMNIPVNVSSDQELCDFQFPSVLRDGDVVIGINASGKNHRLVKETRKKLEDIL